MRALRCRAPHPAAVARGEPDPRVHGVYIMPVPFPVEPTGRLLERWEQMATGHIGGRCPSCKSITEYRILGPVVAS